MNEELEMIYDMAKDSMSQSIDHLKKALLKLRAGKASPSMLEGVLVDYYGSMTPLSQVANVNTPDARMISVQPWEKMMLEPIEKAIINANLGLNPQNNGEMIIINIPALTEERRMELVRKARSEGEDAKISIRNVRKDSNDEVKKMKNDGLPEDMAKDAENEVQNITNSFSKKVDELLADKEKDIMTV
ncbi:MAG: ribosome recycling factor [Crocinitomicaceae bacterium]|nr:ribosome recycling factor [Crocinitomicaceae bacterium]|tara:strand:+ start:12901 stop:13464 length:564 start_codon:yes stop_codon:yes gene_type:complete